MEPLFRFLLMRPAIVQDENAPSIRLAQASQFQAELGQAGQNKNRREALKAVASAFIQTAEFVEEPASLPISQKLKALTDSLNILEQQDLVSNAEVAKAIEDAFEKKPANLVKEKKFQDSVAALNDSLIAIKLLPQEHHRPIEDLTNQLRDIEVVLKVVKAPGFPEKGKTLRRYRRRSVMLPSGADLQSSLSTVEREKELEDERKEADAKKRKKAKSKLDLYRRLIAGIEELTTLSSEHLQVTPQKADPGFMVPNAYRPTALAIQELTQYQQVSQLHILRLQSAVGKGKNTKQIATDNPVQPSITNTQSALPPAAKFLVGAGPFTPLAPGESAFRLKSTAEGSLSQNTLEILKERGLQVANNPLDYIVQRLRSEVTKLSTELDKLLGRPVQRTFKRLGNTLVMMSTPLPSAWNTIVVGSNRSISEYIFQSDHRVPRSHGSVSPAGIADLLVVTQQLVRYEGTDVAHIENILKGEVKEREHSRRRETVELTFRETEITTSEERELESTNRFEMSRETSEIIKEDAKLTAGLRVSGRYGPTVEFAVSAEGSVSRSKEESTKSAAKFSQDVTERSAHKVTERVLERSSLLVTNEVIEKNSHKLDNVAGAGHISGVYQWVSKVYQAQMLNYGIRMMYDFMVPEPAAFLISALQGAHASAVELEKPAPFTLRPDQITETNYHSYVHQYGATDVEAPPEIYITKAFNFDAGGGDPHTNYYRSGQLQIDDGYKAVFGAVGFAGLIWGEQAVVDVILGRRLHRSRTGSGTAMWNTDLDQETDTIPFAIDTFLYAQITATVEVTCQRTDRAMVKWRLDTHAKLAQAYKARLSEYEEKLANLEIQAGVAIRGKNPDLNMDLMKDELKKHCITILTDQHFDLFDAIQIGSNNVPQINLYENEGEGPYVRFFEQAFEWEQMTWITYPYFWGRKSQWDERIAYEDEDPIFNQFLKAGYCRVVVPVRPSFEGAIDHFMTYGELWDGGPLPAISNPLYLPIADEIAERLDRPGDEISQGDPWLVRIPTTLIHLRNDDKLPEWKQDPNGDWVEA